VAAAFDNDPQVFIANSKEGYRRSLYGNDRIYYRINGNIVEIMAIIGRQDMLDLL
jgi:toxin ParE1/3/4